MASTFYDIETGICELALSAPLSKNGREDGVSRVFSHGVCVLAVSGLCYGPDSSIEGGSGCITCEEVGVMTC